MDNINYYRYASKPQHRTADGTETMPSKASKLDVVAMAEAVRDALARNVPGSQLAAERLVPNILAEGRTDAGTNGYDYNNPRAKAAYTALINTGTEHLPAAYVAATLANAETAKRLNKPLAEIWNGTGRSAETGRTGAQHNSRYQDAERVVGSPKNAELTNLVKRVLTQGATSGELFDMRAKTVREAVRAGLPSDAASKLRQASDPGIGYRTQDRGAVKDTVIKTDTSWLQDALPTLITNMIASASGGTPRKLGGNTANLQTELEIALSTPQGRKLLSTAGIMGPDANQTTKP
jgi:hypothetical protein